MRALPAALSELLLRIYRAAHEQAPDAFHDAVLELLRQQIPFDSCTWGIGEVRHEGLIVHSAHLHREIPSRYLGYEEIKGQDTVAFQAAANPGRTLNFHFPTLYQDRSKRGIREYARRVRHANELITGRIPGEGMPLTWIALFRADPDHQFTEEQRQLAELVAPHLMEALTVNRLMHAASANAPEPDLATALADYKGWLHYADPRFRPLLREEWPDAEGLVLPADLVEVLNRRDLPRHCGRRIVAYVTRWNDLALIRMRELRPVDTLSRRELEIARLIAAGRSYKEIASLLDISPATVRNHTQRIHARLGVRSNAEVAAQLRRA